jgi:deoxyribonuclease-1
MVKNSQLYSKVVKCLLRIISYIIIIFFYNVCFSKQPNSFQQAKAQASKIFLMHQQTLYCGCLYNKKNQIDLDSCNMQSASPIKRASRMEWEHIMPAENFGKNMSCWKERICIRNGKRYKGRKCCERISPEFRHREAELYNLWPAEGLINQVRENYLYSEINKTSNYYGCRFKVDKKHHQVEPDDRVKGLVARANLFMKKKYHIKLSKEQDNLYNEWNKKFPPMDWEKVWAKKVAEIEGYENPFIN